MSIKTLSLLLAVFAATCIGAATAHATTNARTWVSNSGTNNSECSITDPCQTFAQAITVTTSGGEINCLNPGSFGAVTINISVTINCEGASNGGITVAGATAITISTADITVNLIGLDINGGTGASVYGVSITAAASVNIRNCKIYNFDTGGISFQPSASGGYLIVDNVLITSASVGISEASTNGISINMSVRNSNINSNNAAIQIGVSGGGHAGATIEQTTLAFSGTGLQVNGSGAVALIGGSTVVNNATGVATQSGGIVYSFKNNQIGGNGHDGTPLTAYPGGPLN